LHKKHFEFVSVVKNVFECEFGVCLCLLPELADFAFETVVGFVSTVSNTWQRLVKKFLRSSILLYLFATAAASHSRFVLVSNLFESKLIKVNPSAIMVYQDFLINFLMLHEILSLLVIVQISILCGF
jgi:hypothetical protein